MLRTSAAFAQRSGVFMSSRSNLSPHDQRAANLTRILLLGLTVGVWIIAQVLVLPRVAHALDNNELETVRRHIEALYSSPMNAVTHRIRKWTTPIRYHTVGLSDADNLVVDTKFQRIANRLGLDIARANPDSEPPINVYLIFSLDRVKDASSPLVRSIFQGRSETDEEYVARLPTFATHPSDERYRFDETSMTFFAVFRNPNGMALDLETQMDSTIFHVLCPSGVSDVIQPSIANRVSTGTTKLSQIDLWFLSALYDEEVIHGISLDEAMPELLRLIQAQADFESAFPPN
jgi:DUF2927 family protein